MSIGPMRYVISVCITHRATDDGPLPLPKPYRASMDRPSREEAEALVEEFWQAATESGMQLYLTTEITPVRAPSPSRSDPSPAGGGNAEGRCRGAGEILLGGGAIIGEALDDVLDLDNWAETRFVTTRKP